MSKRYFFNLTDGTSTIRDQTGLDMGSPSEARSRALNAGPQIVADLAPTVLITDELGKVVHACRYIPVTSQIEPDLLEELRRLRKMLAVAGSIANLAGWGFDPETNELMVSEEAAQMLGVSWGKAPRFKDVFKLVEREYRRPLRKAVRAIEPETNAVDMKIAVRTPTDLRKWIRVFGIREKRSGRDEILGMLADVTQEEDRAANFWNLANLDRLTGLANRSHFLTLLRDALDDGRRTGDRVALAICDVTRLSEINDACGHHVGDALLSTIAQRLRQNLGDGELAGRIGDDEFGILLSAGSDIDTSLAQLSVFQRHLSEEVDILGERLTPGSSIGVAVFPYHGQDPESLLRAAQIALDKAKFVGRDNLVVYSDQMSQMVEKRYASSVQIRRAVAEGRVFPFYQPKVDMITGRIVGYEALLRWQHPTAGIQPPGSLAEIFTDPHLSAIVGQHMLKRVLADMADWQNRGIDFGHVAVNASALDLVRPDFADEVSGLLADFGLAPELLEIEITEAASLEREDGEVERVLEDIASRGVRIVLDDFGTGHGTLVHLMRYPISGVKIDRSFIGNMHLDDAAEAVVHLVISLAASMNLSLVAEGVETVQQATWLRRNGCTIGQGFLFSRPVPQEFVPRFAATKFEIDDRTNHSGDFRMNST